MSEHDEQIPMIIAAAIAASGPKGAHEGSWKAKINEAIPHIAAMLGPGGRQWKIAEEVLGASVFVATYVNHAVEESSTRVMVHIDTGKATKNYPDGIEPIRTHRTDNAQGRSMKERLDKLAPGDEMVVWKSIEASDDGTEKYRVLVHFETRPKRQNSTANGTVAPDRPVTSAPGPAPAAVGSDRTAGATSDNPVVERFQSLPGPVKVRVVKRLRDEGIAFPDPGDDNVDRFIIIIQEEERA